MYFKDWNDKESMFPSQKLKVGFRYFRSHKFTYSIIAPIRDTLEACGFYNTVPKSNFYPTIHDAVLAACAQRRSRTLSAAIDSPKTDRQFFIEDGIPSTPVTPHLLTNSRPEHWESRKNLDFHDDVWIFFCWCVICYQFFSIFIAKLIFTYVFL